MNEWLELTLYNENLCFGWGVSKWVKRDTNGQKIYVALSNYLATEVMVDCIPSRPVGVLYSASTFCPWAKTDEHVQEYTKNIG